MIFVVFLWNLRARAPGRLATSMKVRSATTIDGRRRAKVSEARHGRRRARKGGERPRRPDRALSDRGTRSAGPEATRPCAGPPEARARRGAKAGSARAGRRADAESKRFVERLRSTNRRRAAGCGHGRQGRARRPYGAPRGFIRRAATAAPLIRSSPGRRVAVGRLPGKRRERSIFWAKPCGQTLYGTRGGTIRMWMMCERERGRR